MLSTFYNYLHKIPGMKKLNRWLDSKIYKAGYIKFSAHNNNIRYSIYWPKRSQGESAENLALLAGLVLISTATLNVKIRQNIRDTIVGYGSYWGEKNDAMILLNLIDGCSAAEAVQLAANGIYNEKVPEEDMNKLASDIKTVSTNSTTVPANLFRSYHTQKGNM